MPLLLPPIVVGSPLRHRALEVFPLFAEPGQPVDYQLADEALGSATVAVQEVSDQGSVPELLVHNTGLSQVLFLEGEELRGAKQNRVLNTTVLIPGQAQTRIPVSCVEQGRWHYAGKNFQTARTRSPSSLLYNLKASVTESLKTTGRHTSDQRTVWADVAKTQASFGHQSATRALSDTYETLSAPLAEFQAELPYPEGASGLAVAVAGQVVAVDLFDKPATCRQAWERLLSGFIVDALAGQATGQTEAASVEGLLQEARQAPWAEVKPIGAGQEYRVAFNGSQGSALTVRDTVVHLNVLLAPTA